MHVCSRTITEQIFHINFSLSVSASRRLAETIGTPELEDVIVAYLIQLCHSSNLTGSFNCETVFDNRNAGIFMYKMHHGII